LAWAFATMHFPDPVLFEAIKAESEVQIRNFNPQNLSNMAWAFATLNISAPQLFESIAAGARATVGRLKKTR